MKTIINIKKRKSSIVAKIVQCEKPKKHCFNRLIEYAFEATLVVIVCRLILRLCVRWQPKIITIVVFFCRNIYRYFSSILYFVNFVYFFLSRFVGCDKRRRRRKYQISGEFLFAKATVFYVFICFFFVRKKIRSKVFEFKNRFDIFLCQSITTTTTIFFFLWVSVKPTNGWATTIFWFISRFISHNRSLISIYRN